MKKYFLFFLMVPVLTGCLSDGGAPDDKLSRSHPFLGNPQAKVTIQEFSDFQCPACAAISPQVEALVRQNPSLYKMEYYHFPLPQHEHAYSAGEAAECAFNQGKFWEYADGLFAQQKALGSDLYFKLADTLKLDSVQFKTCVEGRQTKDRVKTDLIEGRQRGVNATPTFYVNGQKVQFNGLETFEKYLKSVAY